MVGSGTTRFDGGVYFADNALVAELSVLERAFANDELRPLVPAVAGVSGFELDALEVHEKDGLEFGFDHACEVWRSRCCTMLSVSIHVASHVHKDPQLGQRNWATVVIDANKSHGKAPFLVAITKRTEKLVYYS